MIIGNPIMAGVSGPAASIFVTGLSETDTVTATNGSKTLTGKWTQIPNPASVVPDGYTQLEYIQSTGTQYIDTGVKSINQRLRTKVKFSDLTSTDHFFIGAFWQNGTELIYHPRVYNGEFSVVYAGNSKSLGIVPSANTVYEIDSTMYSGNQNVKINGTNYLTSNDTYSFTANYSLYLFASHDAGETNGVYKPGKMLMYYAELYDNGLLVRDFIPAKRNSDHAIGLYDLVSGTFFENSGTGEFIAGAEVPQTFDGFLIKPIRELGTWTVTATDGTNTATQDVLVDVITEYEIEMDLTKLWLYRDGDECEDVTGGWTANGYTRNGYTVYAGTKESDALKVSLSSSSGSQMCILGTNIAIDFSGYSKCCIEYLVSETNTYNPTIATKTTKDADSTTLFAKYGSSNFTANVTKILEIDISSVNGSGYFEWYCTNVATHRIYRVWLE